MAYNNDIVGLLTGTSSARLSPVAPTREQRMLERAGRYSQGMTQSIGQMFGTDLRTPAQKLQSGLKDIDMTNPDDLARLAKLQQATGDSAGAARTTAQRNAILEKQELSLEKQELEDKEAADRISFSEYIRNKFPAQPALIQLAESGQLNPSNFKDFLNDPKSSGFLKGTTFTVQDEEGNAFTMVPAFNKDTGKIENTYSPIGTKGPAKPFGKTKVTGGEFSLSAEDETARRVGQKGAETKEATFGKLKAMAEDSIPTLRASQADLNKAEELLNSIETGGPINIAATGLEGFFGVKSADKGQLEIILGLNMMSSLKPLFGGLISNQEAERLQAIYAGMSKGNLANAGILRQLKKAVDDNLFKAGLYQKTKTSEEFSTLLKQMYPEDTKPEKTRVTWESL